MRTTLSTGTQARNDAERLQSDRAEAAGIAGYYLDKGYDVQRRVIRGTGISVWDIYDGETGETLKGRITYHREDRGPHVDWFRR